MTVMIAPRTAMMLLVLVELMQLLFHAAACRARRSSHARCLVQAAPVEAPAALDELPEERWEAALFVVVRIQHLSCADFHFVRHLNYGCKLGVINLRFVPFDRFRVMSVALPTARQSKVQNHFHCRLAA